MDLKQYTEMIYKIIFMNLENEMRGKTSTIEAAATKRKVNKNNNDESANLFTLFVNVLKFYTYNEQRREDENQGKLPQQVIENFRKRVFQNKRGKYSFEELLVILAEVCQPYLKTTKSIPVTKDLEVVPDKPNKETIEQSFFRH